MALRFGSKEAMFIVPDTSKSKFDDVEIFDKHGNPTGEIRKVAKVAKLVEREENPAEVARRKVRHERSREKDYAKQRAKAYPDFGEFAQMMFERIDVIVKSGGTLVTDAERAWYNKCLEVRKNHPKPK